MRKNIKKIGIIGHFGFGADLANGQTIKTKIFTKALEKQYSDRQVLKKDTHGGLKAIVSLPFQALCLLRRTENIIIFPAQRGVRITAPLLMFLNRFFHRGLHYCVIGGWLPELLKGYPALAEKLKRFTGLYVETNTLKNALEAMGFQNVFVVPNCKFLEAIPKVELRSFDNEPYCLCTFSRVMQEKGIEDAVRAVESVNKACGKIALTLDIYGQIEATQTEWFKNFKESFPEYVRYGGIVPFDESVDTLKEYFALLFPTRFYTEGIPGTIIDAYAAGVPVIAAQWESFHDIVDDGITGIGYPSGDVQGLIDILTDVCEDPDKLNRMRENCIDRAKCYLPENALKPLFEQIGV